MLAAPVHGVVVIGTQALDGATGAGVGMKARTLKFKLYKLRPRVVYFNHVSS